MSESNLRVFRATVATACALVSVSSNAAESKIVAGYLEKVWLGNNEIAFQAKLDTGANSSSLNAAKSEVFERDGQKWVRIDLTNRWNQSYQFERRVKKTVLIRRAGTKKQRRFIIDLKLCVGGRTMITEFSLADRTGQSYQVLVGRKFLRDQILVDAGKKFLVSRRCNVDK